MLYAILAASAASFAAGTVYGPKIEAVVIREYLKAKAAVLAEVETVKEDIRKHF